MLDFLRRQSEGARYVTSVCTGALVLAAAGLLEGRRATTHWASHDLLEPLGRRAGDGAGGARRQVHQRRRGDRRHRHGADDRGRTRRAGRRPRRSSSISNTRRRRRSTAGRPGDRLHRGRGGRTCQGQRQPGRAGTDRPAARGGRAADRDSGVSGPPQPRREACWRGTPAGGDPVGVDAVRQARADDPLHRDLGRLQPVDGHRTAPSTGTTSSASPWTSITGGRLRASPRAAPGAEQRAREAQDRRPGRRARRGPT